MAREKTAIDAAYGGGRICTDMPRARDAKDTDGYTWDMDKLLRRIRVSTLINRYLCMGINSACVTGKCDLCAYGRRYRELKEAAEGDGQGKGA